MTELDLRENILTEIESESFVDLWKLEKLFMQDNQIPIINVDDLKGMV